jgi:pyrroline-5-carboxylate reductase
MKLGIIGVGKMGYAIIHGITYKKLYKTEDIICYDLHLEKQQELKALGYQIGKNEIDVIENSEIIILAIKPQNFSDLMKKIKNLKKYPIIVSIAAGISIEYLQTSISKDGKYVRVMPNTPLMIGLGATAISKTDNITKEEYKRVQEIFSSVGIVKEIDEIQMDDIIPANGGLPAYAYYFIKGFIDSSVKRGIDYNVAKELVCESIIGSANMILSSQKSIDELIIHVCSPGGTTIEGIKVFEKNQLLEIIDEAAIACSNRSRELNNLKK